MITSFGGVLSLCRSTVSPFRYIQVFFFLLFLQMMSTFSRLLYICLVYANVYGCPFDHTVLYKYLHPGHGAMIEHSSSFKMFL